MVFGKIILNIFGANYATQGYGLLIVLSLASLPKILSYLFATVLRIKHQIRSIIYIYLSYAIVIPLGCIISIHFQKGLMSFGWAILFGECLIAIVFSLVAFKYIKRESLPTNQKTKL
jgi:O-antigen/teichoic acid export membrane protein